MAAVIDTDMNALIADSTEMLFTVLGHAMP